MGSCPLSGFLFYCAVIMLHQSSLVIACFQLYCEIKQEMRDEITLNQIVSPGDLCHHPKTKLTETAQSVCKTATVVANSGRIINSFSRTMSSSNFPPIRWIFMYSRRFVFGCNLQNNSPALSLLVQFLLN